MGVPKPQYTAEQLLFMSSPGNRLELVRGELIEMAPAGFRHGEVADVAFVSRERLEPGESPAGYLAMAPDLVVEVISPTDSLQDVEARAETWLRFGVQAVWVVDPAERTVSVYTARSSVLALTTRDRLDGGPALPDFSCPVQAFFDD